MRRLFILLMIVLLPLRGWAGDLMGVQMAAGATRPAIVGGMPAHCTMPGHADASGSPTQGADGAPVPAGMDNCAACELCIPLSGLATTRLELLNFAHHAKPLMGRIAFISAWLARAVEPPIS